MFNKFSNPETFMDAYKYSLNEEVTPSIPTPSKPAPSVAQKPPTPTTTPAPKPTTPSPSTTGQCKVSENYIASPMMHRKNLNKIIMEYMDMRDPSTVKQVTSLNEAEQNTYLLSLTGKLYELIVGKIDDIDFGDIPNTKGNITKLSKYKQMRECVELLHDIFVQYKENPESIQVIDNAMSNLENNAELFISGYAGDIQFVKMVYETTSLAVVNAIGFMIAVCIEYIKTPKKEGLTIVLNKTGIRKVKDHLLYENLVKFNESCKNGDLDKALRPLIKEKVKDLVSIAGAFYALRVIAAIGVVVAAIIPFLRQMVYFFYASRVRMSTYLDAQADLLEMNATELRNNDSIQTVDDKKRVIARQMKIAKQFHDIANKIAIEDRNSENSATRELKEDSKKFKMDEVNSNPANVAVDGPLF